MEPSQRLSFAVRFPKLYALYQVTLYFLIAICIVTFVRFFIAQPFVISGTSMSPTFEANEYLVIDELTYNFRKPVRDDVIIFKYPLDPSIYFIKRVIGVPSNIIRIEGRVLTVLDSGGAELFRLIDDHPKQPGKSDQYSTQLGRDEYFVLGDNREASSDSRMWGPVQERFIIGRPAFRLYPFHEAGVLPGIAEYVEQDVE